MDAAETWASIGVTWQEAFAEAWTSWCAGCWGIGAVVTDGTGEIVSRGRNRILEAPTTVGVLAGTPLAHAEINALAVLPMGQAPESRLYTTLEPCVLCASAIRLLGVPEVHYAGADPLFDGIHDHLSDHPYGADRPCELVGPVDGPLGRFASLLPLTFMAFWSPGGPVFELHQRETPELAALAEAVVRHDLLAAVSGAGGGVVEAMDAVWTSLA